MSTSSQIADVPTPFSPLLKLNLPSPEEYRKRKVALISGEYCRVLGALNRVSFSLVACRYHRAGWVVLVSGPSLPPFAPPPAWVRLARVMCLSCWSSTIAPPPVAVCHVPCQRSGRWAGTRAPCMMVERCCCERSRLSRLSWLLVASRPCLHLCSPPARSGGDRYTRILTGPAARSSRATSPGRPDARLAHRS